MLRNSLSKVLAKPEGFKWWMGLVLPVWVFVGFMAAQVIVGLLLSLLSLLRIPLKNISEPTIQAIGSFVVYIVALLTVIGLPWLVRKYKTSKAEIGLDHHLTWTDLLLAPAAFIVYILLSFVLTSIFSQFPFYNVNQVQNTGFSGLSYGYEYFLAFFTLVIVAPIAEEILFRGYLLGKLRRYLPIWAAVLVTSLLFGIVHFAWNVGVDVFVLSIVLSILRIRTGRLAPSILLHMIKNGVAFYFLFINPLL
ncbi:MAG: CPBP family intramembrane metalloprotease [Candidatus Microsaccharimonas sossegonensis]|uniref:CPBP family intramembrane metalloprotease n=1 Tax=Candidatus Microsaccharimonas sossegonensis TaxID=2506948 RepID=A0A4Q0AHI7_9BACT|nr:MAG: CPBP family intramembrane metalloprotease [Candidatus Microsaccharimonas sossegonensis]